MKHPFDRIFTAMTKPFYAFIYIGLIFISYFCFDQKLAYLLEKLALKTKMPLLDKITKLGEWPIYIILLFLLAIFFRYIYHNHKYQMRSWFLWLTVFIPGSIAFVLKIFLGRARPELLFSQKIYGFYGIKLDTAFWSFPSGHTTNIMGIILGLCIIFPRFCYSLLFLGICIVSTRILLTHHYLSDVLATLYLTLLEVGLIYKISLKRNLYEKIS